MIRAIVAVLIVGLYFSGRINGLTAIVLGVVAALLLATSIVGWCPLYVPLRISTRSDRPASTAKP